MASTICRRSWPGSTLMPQGNSQDYSKLRFTLPLEQEKGNGTYCIFFRKDGLSAVLPDPEGGRADRFSPACGTLARPLQSMAFRELEPAFPADSRCYQELTSCSLEGTPDMFKVLVDLLLRDPDLAGDVLRSTCLPLQQGNDLFPHGLEPGRWH